MKKSLITVFALVLGLVVFTFVNAQEGAKKVPAAKVKNLKGETVSTETFGNDGKPFVISFWATWCKPCLTEMKTVSELYPEWQEQTGVKIYAISIDDVKSSKNVAPFVKGKNLKFEVMLDENSDFKRAMSVNNPPHTFLFNGKGELVWQHNGFAPGDEEELFEQIKKAAGK
jgi:peroxiredoxin